MSWEQRNADFCKAQTDAQLTYIEAERRDGARSSAWDLVRCRDCKFYTPESMTREERGFGVYENMWEPGMCLNPERCSTAWDSFAGQRVPVGIVTEPDGFCAWGERRDS